MTSAITPLPCGCFFRGRKFVTDPKCAEHAEDDESYHSMTASQARWQAKYGVLPFEERRALIEKEQREGLAALKAAGIVPTMSADELTRLTRDNHNEQ
jgi:hypothetical protein